MKPNPTHIDPEGFFLVKEKDLLKVLQSHLTANQMMLWTYLNAATRPSSDLGEIARQIGLHPKAIKKGLSRLRKLGLLHAQNKRGAA